MNVSLLSECLPQASPWDPAEDPSSSMDPLGTVGMAEQLADILLPGLTARTWRARQLTFVAVAALIAEHVANHNGGNEETRLEARLVLERFFVTAIVMKEIHAPAEWKEAVRQLPGVRLARAAVRAGHQPLGRRNFLKGQAINGPFGVIQRLARELDIISQENRLSAQGKAVLSAWASEQELPGILDEGVATRREGAKWLRGMVKAVGQNLSENKWPVRSWAGWESLVRHLRPDESGWRERRALFGLLADPARSARRHRVLELLLSPDVSQTYRKLAAHGSRGERDRGILWRKVRPAVRGEQSSLDESLGVAIDLIETYEQVCTGMESVFRTLIWALSHRNGQCKQDSLIKDQHVKRELAAIRPRLVRAAEQLLGHLRGLDRYPELLDAAGRQGLTDLVKEALTGTASELALAQAVLNRHRCVQRRKSKGVWIDDDGQSWILLTGFGDISPTPPSCDWHAYLHAFRIPNAYSLLRDLGKFSGASVADEVES